MKVRKAYAVNNTYHSLCDGKHFDIDYNQFSTSEQFYPKKRKGESARGTLDQIQQSLQT